AALDAVATALRATNEFVTHAGSACGANLFFAEVADTSAAHMLKAKRSPHQDDRQGSHFHRGVPAVEIGTWVSFGYTNGLSAAHSFFKSAPLFDFRQHNVGCGIQDAGETPQLRGR